MLINKDDHTIDVSPDAFKSMYKRLGYKPVNETSISKSKSNETKLDNNMDDLVNDKVNEMSHKNNKASK